VNSFNAERASDYVTRREYIEIGESESTPVWFVE
jgi:hypothetical protein